MIEELFSFFARNWKLCLISAVIAVWTLASTVAVTKKDNRLFQGSGSFLALFGLLAGVELGGRASQLVSDVQSTNITTLEQNLKLELDRLELELQRSYQQSLEQHLDTQVTLLKILKKSVFRKSEPQIEQIQALIEVALESQSDLQNSQKRFDYLLKKNSRLSAANVRLQEEGYDILSQSYSVLSETVILELIMVALGALQASFGYLLIDRLKRRAPTC